ncbi:MAG TPA: 23S rRNA (uracil(1939)-C(5))-methyltransferase RlmD [Clostridiaceae bacterium]
MKENPVVIKNEEYDIDIVDIGYEGEGIGKYKGFTIIVPGALDTEKARVKIVKVNKNLAFGKLISIKIGSRDRVEPICSIYKRCGGCQLQHLSYGGQLKYKSKRVKECIERIGGISDVVIEPIIAMEHPYNYRNKVQLPVRKENGEIQIGFYAPRSHNIINMDSCLLQNDEAEKVIEILKAWMKLYNMEAYNEETDAGLIRHIMVRNAYKTNEVMVVLVTNERNIPSIEELLISLKENIPNLKSIIQNININKTNLILGRECVTLWGKDTISDNIGSLSFNISPLSFFQVNPIQTEKLYNKVLEYADLKGSETVFDAYCGTGTISLFLAKASKKVYGIEIIPEAIENAKLNGAENGINNAEFIVGKAEEAIPELINKGIIAEVVVVDPPRKGCEERLLIEIGKMAPEKIIYVSCDPATLARDLKIIVGFGYKVTKVQPVDMFPMTAHVETVVLIEKGFVVDEKTSATLKKPLQKHEKEAR